MTFTQVQSCDVPCLASSFQKVIFAGHSVGIIPGHRIQLLEDHADSEGAILFQDHHYQAVIKLFHSLMDDPQLPHGLDLAL